MSKGEHNLHLALHFTSQQMGRVFLVSVCLVAIVSSKGECAGVDQAL